MTVQTEIHRLASEGALQFIADHYAALSAIDQSDRPVVETLILSAYTRGMLAANHHALSMMEDDKR